MTYDATTDSLTVILNEQASIAESNEDKPGVIRDYNKEGNLVSLEVLDASQRARRDCRPVIAALRKDKWSTTRCWP